MRSIFLALMISGVFAATAHAQLTPTKPLNALVLEGYEIKAMSGITRGLVFLQKGTTAYVCELPASLPTDRSMYGIVIGSVVCAAVK